MVPTTTAAQGTQAHEYGRPVSIEDASNRYFIHPLSERMVGVAYQLGISANTLSFMGLGCGLLAGWFYYQLPGIPTAVAGFLAMVAWHVLDGADGKLARLTGTSSAFGRIIDGICDHVVFAAVYVALALHLIQSGYSADIWWIVFGAGLSHAVQAAGYEERRQKYQRRREGLIREQVQAPLLTVSGKRSFLASLYDGAQKLVAGGDYGLDAALDRMRARDPQQAGALISKTRPMVKAWALLNANNRTLLIFLFAALGAPLYYFLFELIVWNIALFALMIAEWRLETALARQTVEGPQ